LERPSSTGAAFAKTFETDSLPLAVACDDIDIRVRCDIAATAAADRMLPALVGIIALHEETRLLHSFSTPIEHSLIT